MRRPKLKTPVSVDVPKAVRHTASNGIEIYTLPSDDFEVLRITFVFAAGTSGQSQPFSASTTLNMLAEGSLDMTAAEIAEKLDFYGSFFDVNIDRDYSYITFCCLSKYVAQTLLIAEEILLRPVFPEKELDSYRHKRMQQLSIERAKVDTKAREEFAKALFGQNHPYGISYDGELYRSLTREHIVGLYNKLYTAGNCFAVCSGRIGDTELEGVESLVGKMSAGGAATKAAFPHPVSRHYAFVNHKDAVQSSVRIGRVMFTRNHPDYIGMQVTATILGGYFGSRLMRTLREERGYTYGVAAVMINLERSGYFAVATEVGSEVTREALELIYDQIERLSNEPVPEEELALVKNIMTGETMRILDGPFGIADVTIENIQCGGDNSAVSDNLRRIREITPEDILRLANKYLKRADLVTVVAGAEDPFGEAAAADVAD